MSLSHLPTRENFRAEVVQCILQLAGPVSSPQIASQTPSVPSTFKAKQNTASTTTGLSFLQRSLQDKSTKFRH